MSAKELDRLRVIQLVLERRMTRVEAGGLLGIGARQLIRLCGAYKRDGAAGLVSRKRGRVGNRKLPPAIEAQVVELSRRFYQQMGPTLKVETQLNASTADDRIHPVGQVRGEARHQNNQSGRYDHCRQVQTGAAATANKVQTKKNNDKQEQIGRASCRERV